MLCVGGRMIPVPNGKSISGSRIVAFEWVGILKMVPNWLGPTSGGIILHLPTAHSRGCPGDQGDSMQ